MSLLHSLSCVVLCLLHSLVVAMNRLLIWQQKSVFCCVFIDVYMKSMNMHVFEANELNVV